MKITSSSITRLINAMLLLGLSVILFSCKKDKVEPDIIEYSNVCPESTYCFIRNDETSVDYYYSTIHLNQLDEFSLAFDAVDQGEFIPTGILNGYFQNDITFFDDFEDEEYPYFSFFTPNANFQGVKLDSTANPARISYYNSLFLLYSQDSEGISFASEGNAGIVIGEQIQNTDCLIDETGRQYSELFKRGLVADIMYYDIHENLIPYILEADTGYIQIDTLNYSNNEKRWDNIFGYIGLNEEFETMDHNCQTIAQMSDLVDPALNSSQILINSLKDGRQAIFNSNEEQALNHISDLQLTLHRIASGTIIQNLKSAISAGNDFAVRFSNISKAYSFIQALNYSSPSLSISTGQVTEFQNILGTDYYSITDGNLLLAIEWIENNTEITPSESEEL